MPSERIPQLDWLKGLMIILMVAFHLVWFTGMYPYAKSVVYTFHMPVFLFLSGYLCNTQKTPSVFVGGVFHVFAAYAVMEAGYAAATTFFNVRDGIGTLTFPNILEAVFVSPVGPYWYLHTYVLCMLICYASFRTAGSWLAAIPFAALLLYCADRYLGIMWLANGLYFLAGAALRLYGTDMKSLVTGGSPLAALPAAVLCMNPENLNRAVPGGVLIVISVISVSLWLYRVSGKKIRSMVEFLGRNTLAVLLFSPVFTMLCRYVVPLFGFDKGRMLYMLFSVIVVICGSLFVGYVMDRMRISRIFAGRDFIA